MQFIGMQKLGINGDRHRLWIESQRLHRLGFVPGTPLEIRSQSGQLTLKPAILGENHVSSRQVPNGRRPIIDLASQSLLAGLAEYSEVKILASFERIQVSPSHRAFAIARSRSLMPPFRVLEVFAGGGTMTAALSGNPVFQVVAGVEIKPDYADEWQAQHPDATLVQADLRSLHTTELPEFDVLIGGIPCTCHSNLGRAKKSLAGKPELGDTGDLFLPVVTLVSERMPAAVVFENVPSFGTSLAGELLVSHLRRLGYHVTVEILRPNEEWGELEDRQRWLMIGTLASPFTLQVPRERCTTPVSAFLDPPNETQDHADAERIARTIAGLRAHNARHRAAGHGFGFTEIRGDELRLPVIPKSYHKINTGPFVRTPFGLRLLRQAEIERLHGHTLLTRHYATAVQMLGQGVLTRVFRAVFQQLANHLAPAEHLAQGRADHGRKLCTGPSESCAQAPCPPCCCEDVFDYLASRDCKDEAAKDSASRLASRVSLNMPDESQPVAAEKHDPLAGGWQQRPHRRRTLSSLDEILTVDECADWLGLRPRDLLEKVRAGRIPAIRLNQRVFRFHPRTVLMKLGVPANALGAAEAHDKSQRTWSAGRG